jgi:hypothetical protein
MSESFVFRRFSRGIEYYDRMTSDGCTSVSDLLVKLKGRNLLGFGTINPTLTMKYFSQASVDTTLTVQQLISELDKLPDEERILNIYTDFDKEFSKRAISNYPNISKVTDLLISQGFEIYANALLVDPSQYIAYRKMCMKDWQENVQDPELAEALYNLFHETRFDKLEYQLKFALLRSGDQSSMTIYDRDHILRFVRDSASNPPNDEFCPVMISASRGMGKSFILKMIASQCLEDEFKSERIEAARSCGRIIAFD